MKTELIGYADKFSVASGERIRFMVSTDLPSYDAKIVRLIHADENPNGPGFKEEIIESEVNHNYPGRKQIATSGSYLVVENNAVLASLSSFTLQAWIFPTTPNKGAPQGILTRWSVVNNTGYGLFIGKEGDLGLWVGDGAGKVERIYTKKSLRASHWYFVAATYDETKQIVSLYQHPLTDWPHNDSTAIIEKPVQVQVSKRNDAPFLIAAGNIDAIADKRVAKALYNGKIDSPRLFSRALAKNEIDQLKNDDSPQDIAGDAIVASWDFSDQISSSHIIDTSLNKFHGVAINMPTRAMTGYNWGGNSMDFKNTPQEYGAIHFHDDDLEDAGWATDFELEIPDNFKSGVYAARLASENHEDYIPFIIRPSKGKPRASILYLIPTMTYLAYANDRMDAAEDHKSGFLDSNFVIDPLDDYLAEHPEFAMSLYDTHKDGSGCYYSSKLRPIVNMRPKYRLWITRSPRHLGADLYLIDWMEEKGFSYDVVTDEDLHYEGVDLLANYKVLITGTHPEYYTTPMLKALEQYRSSGGRIMYLGGNGFYWVTSMDDERPHIIEVRKGFAGTRAYNTAPGECYHSTTGEMGGLWRYRGKTPNKLVGVGFTAMGWYGHAPGYKRKAGSFDQRASFIFEGIGEDEIIGNYGLYLGGGAGDEIDRLDYQLGSPPHTLLLASATDHHSSMMPVIEDYMQIFSSLLKGEARNIQADMVYFETPNGGAVFSTGAITWCGCLSHHNYENNVSKITENVLKKFQSD